MMRLLLTVPLLALSACGINSGTVTAKTHADAYSNTYYVDQCFAYDKNMNCTVNMPMPQTEYVPECWGLDLRNQDKTGSVCVDQATWNATEIGSRFNGGS